MWNFREQSIIDENNVVMGNRCGKILDDKVLEILNFSKVKSSKLMIRIFRGEKVIIWLVDDDFSNE